MMTKWEAAYWASEDATATEETQEKVSPFSLLCIQVLPKSKRKNIAGVLSKKPQAEDEYSGQFLYFFCIRRFQLTALMIRDN